MLALQVKKRNEIRTVYVPHYKFWKEADAAEIARDEQRTRDSYPAKNFRFEGSLTIYRRGQLTVYFGADGYACEGYSYDACMFARVPASEDFPKGRVIWNDTNYSTTTNSKHRYPLMRFAMGPVTSRVEVTDMYWNGVTGKDEPWTHYESVHRQWNERCEVMNMPWRCTGHALRAEIETWVHAKLAGHRAASRHEMVRERKAREHAARAAHRTAVAAGKHLQIVKDEVA